MEACLPTSSFFLPISTLQEDVAYRLRSAATLALIGVGLADRVEISTQADLAGTHLRDGGAYCSMCAQAHMCVKYGFSWPRTEFEELSTILDLFPG
jgi:hypothetical protein